MMNALLRFTFHFIILRVYMFDTVTPYTIIPSMKIAALREHLVNGGRVERDDTRDGSHYRLVIPPISADAYADAQLDDYEHGLPRHFTNLPPQHLHIRARFSQREMKGTAGFGFWNHPFSRTGDVLEPPSNVWYFNGSAESDLRIARGMPGHGFKAAMLNGGQMPKGVMRVVGSMLTPLLKAPFLANLLMSAGRAVVNAREVILTLDMTEWHDYEIDWLSQVAIFRVDGAEVLRAPRPPRSALGFAAWVDNYRATASGGAYQFAYVAAQQEQWLEMVIMDAND